MTLVHGIDYLNLYAIENGAWIVETPEKSEQKRKFISRTHTHTHWLCVLHIPCKTLQFAECASHDKIQESIYNN
jgi:hypothetical protein